MDDLFKGRQFDREIIILCVRWYLRFKLSFRDLVEMMAERGISLGSHHDHRLVKKCVFVGGDACSLAQSTHKVVDQPSFWGLISLRFEQRISNAGVAARFGVKRRQFPILVSNADVSIAEYCRSKPPKAFRWLPFLSRGHGSVGGRVFPSAKHSRVQPRAHGRAARLVFLGFFGVHGTRLPWGPRGLQQLSGHIACCLSSTVPDWDREYNQGNCISKEREEFDEIILIPGGFFEFSA